MGTSPTTFHAIYNQLPPPCIPLTYFGRAKKAHEEAPRRLPSPLGVGKNGMHYCTL